MYELTMSYYTLWSKYAQLLFYNWTTMILYPIFSPFISRISSLLVHTGIFISHTKFFTQLIVTGLLP